MVTSGQEAALCFVCVVMVIAIIGNGAVLLVFKFRWRASSASKIYILTLAVIDLLGAILAIPTELELTPVGEECWEEGEIRALCGSAVLLQLFIHVASTFLLVVMATSRLVRVVKLQSAATSMRENGRTDMCGRLSFRRLRKVTVRVLRATDTVRGAKIACAVVVAAAVIVTSSSPFFFANDPLRNETTTMMTMTTAAGASTTSTAATNTTTTTTSTTPSPTHSTTGSTTTTSITEYTTTTKATTASMSDIPSPQSADNTTSCESTGKMRFRSCHLLLSEHSGLHALHTLLFILFAVCAVVLLSLYSAVLRRIWSDGRQDKRGLEDSQDQDLQSERTEERRRSSVFFTQQSCDSFGSLLDVFGDLSDVRGSRDVIRTKSDSDATATSTGLGGGGVGVGVVGDGNNVLGQVDFQRSFSSPYTGSEMALLRSRRLGHVTTRARAGSAASFMPESETNRQTFFPPVAYSAQLRSLISLNMERSRSRSEGCQGQGQVRDRRGTASSMQVSKFGSRSKQVTLVFVLITFIYLVSYLPFFVVEMLKDGEGSAWKEVFLRSYLISNAANPVVYGVCNQFFRNTVWKLVRCRRDVI